MKKILHVLAAAAIIVLALYIPSFAIENISGPTVYNDKGDILDVDRKMAGTETWASARSSIDLDEDEALVGIFQITPDNPGYTGGGTIEFVCNTYTDAQIYRFNGSWVKIPTSFNTSTCKATAYTPYFSTYFALVVTHKPDHVPSVVPGVTISDANGKSPAGDVTAITNSNTVNVTASSLGVSNPQAVKLYDISHLTGAAPHNVTINAPAGVSSMDVYVLAGSGTWNKVKSGVSSAVLQLDDDAALAVVYGAQTNPGTLYNPDAGTKFELSGGTVYYAGMYWGNGVPFPDLAHPYKLQSDKAVIIGPTYSNGYRSFYLNDQQYFIPIDGGTVQSKTDSGASYSAGTPVFSTTSQTTAPATVSATPLSFF